MSDRRYAAALGALVLAVTVGIGSTLWHGLRVQWTDPLWALALAWMAWSLWRGGAPLSLPRRSIAGIAALGTAALLVTALHPSPAGAARLAALAALVATSWLCAAGSRALRPGTVMAVAAVLAAAHASACVAGTVLLLAGLDNPFAWQYQGGFYVTAVRATGLTDHPDRAALVLVILHGLLVASLDAGRSAPAGPGARAGAALAWLLPPAALLTLAPFSLSAFAQLGLHLCRSPAGQPRRRPARLAGTTLVAGSVAVMLLVSYVVPVKDPERGWHAAPAPRLLVQRSALPAIAAAPLAGQGLGTRGATVFATGYPPRVTPMPTDPHSLWLDLLASGGVVLLAGWLAFAGGLLAPWRGGPGLHRAIGAVWLATGLVHSLSDERVVYAGLGVLAGLACAAGRTAQQGSADVSAGSASRGA